MWIAVGLSSLVHHARAHRFFSTARWSPDALGLALALVIVQRFLSPEAAIEVAVDDTLFRRYGRKVHAAAYQHDGSAQGPRKIGFGNCWVIVGVVVWLPVMDRPVCLPVLFRLWRPKSGVSKVDHAVDLVKLLNGCLTSFAIAPNFGGARVTDYRAGEQLSIPTGWKLIRDESGEAGLQIVRTSHPGQAIVTVPQ